MGEGSCGLDLMLVGNDEEVVMEQVLQRRALGTKQECTDREGGYKLAATRSVAAM